MTDPSPARLRAAARELALRAGAVQLRWFRELTAQDVRFKGRRNPVTQADLDAETLIVEELAHWFPDHRVVAEEEGDRGGESEYEWIVDPLDGTVNFSHGIPVFAAAIAVRRNQELLASAIYAPALNELFEAERGGGAWCNGRRLAVSQTSTIEAALLATGFAYGRNDVADNNVGHFNDLILECRDIRRLGSAAYDFAQVAAGRYDAFWELHLSPWDVAAGALLVQEAGGRVTDLHGGSTMVEQGHVLAANPALHAPLLEILGG